MEQLLLGGKDGWTVPLRASGECGGGQVWIGGTRTSSHGARLTQHLLHSLPNAELVHVNRCDIPGIVAAYTERFWAACTCSPPPPPMG